MPHTAPDPIPDATSSTQLAKAIRRQGRRKAKRGVLTWLLCTVLLAAASVWAMAPQTGGRRAAEISPRSEAVTLLGAPARLAARAHPSHLLDLSERIPG